MKDVLMIVHTMGTMLPSDNDRFSYIAKMLLDKGCNVEMVTSDFEHHKKSYRDKRIADLSPFKITFLHEMAYKKNISIQRIRGHLSFARELKKYLDSRKQPDVIYCAIPPINSAYVAAEYAKKNNIRFVVDLQDLWPESFTIALGNNLFSRAALYPLKKRVDKIYAQADGAIAVSDTYAQRIRKVNSKAREILSVYLGTDGNTINEIVSNARQIDKMSENSGGGYFRIAYIGNLGKSYDFQRLIEAVALLQKNDLENIELCFIGDGTEHAAIENLVHQHHVRATITGYLPYNEMFAQLIRCQVAVNPIKKGTSSSVVNKVGDYAAAGIPVINTQDNAEYRRLLEKYNAGLNTIPENSDDIARKIHILYQSEALRREMGENERKLFKDKFDRSKTYKRIIDTILGNS
jgi:glycosyltransferase involved in cell wall biosynthesis